LHSMKSALSPSDCSFIRLVESRRRISSMLTTLPGNANGRSEEIKSPTKQRPKMIASWVRYFMSLYITLLEGFLGRGTMG